MNEDLQLTLVEHLGELRNRLVKIVIGIIVGAFISYKFIEDIIAFLVRPAGDLEFIYLSPPDLFVAYLKTAIVCGIVVSLPFTMFQIWKFIKPGLKTTERKYLLVTLFMAIVFFLIGVFFAYFGIIPMTIRFFIEFSSDKIAPLFSFEKYLGFTSSIMLSFGLVFELPLVVILLTQLGLVSSATFKKIRKVVILIILIVAAILTPPDVVSQTMMALPMVFLYEFSIHVSVLIEKKKAKRKLREENKE